MMKRIILSLLILAMLIPACALATVSVVDSNGNTVSPTGGQYNLAAGSYTLQGEDSTGVSIHATGDVTLNLDGLIINDTENNGLSVTGESGATVTLSLGSNASSLTGHKHGVYSEIPLTIDEKTEGTGELTATSYRKDAPNNEPINGGRSSIRSLSTLTIAGGTIEAQMTEPKGSARGIDADGDLTISGGKVTAVGPNAAIHSLNGDICIANADVTAKDTEIGIYSNVGKLEITDSIVNATGTKGVTGSYGSGGFGLVSANGTTITGGNVLSQGEAKAVFGTVTAGNGTRLSHKDNEEEPWAELTAEKTGKKMLRSESAAEKTPAPDTETTPAPDTETTPAPDTEATPAPGANPTPAPGANGGTGASDGLPKTGDASSLLLWLGLLAACGAAALMLRRKEA